MNKTKLTEAEVLSVKDRAFELGQFIPYYQPQFNHSTGMIMGAEALARWENPDFGLVSPADFIPVFEKFGDITKLDLVIFERSCRFIRRMLDSGITPPPISTNLARRDLYEEGLADKLNEIRERYDVPVELLRLEITESAAIGGIEHVNNVLEQFHDYGFLVEMDDFGSGYSSLNMLKDINIDVLKLDMAFMESSMVEGGRGGAILSSIVRMARLLGLPVIAEGVETKEQADFLEGISCYYIQGHLYAKAMREDDFGELLKKSTTAVTLSELESEATIDTTKFLDPNSAESLIFSKFVGPAAMFVYDRNGLEIIRVNERYLRELGMNMTPKDAVAVNPLDNMDEPSRLVFMESLKRVISTGEEQECETRHLIKSECCGDDYIYVRNNLMILGKNDGDYLFYVMIRNITSEKRRVQELSNYERQFKQVTEQVNIYYWEYTVATKEMRPCFRCMRDLGLPAVVRNYPEPAIEQGIFPQDYADMYRDWHRQIAEGVKELEGVIPLTVGRVPFRVKYVTEFDELGRPIKAYGSATLVVE